MQDMKWGLHPNTQYIDQLYTLLHCGYLLSENYIKTDIFNLENAFNRLTLTVCISFVNPYICTKIIHSINKMYFSALGTYKAPTIS